MRSNTTHLAILGWLRLGLSILSAKERTEHTTVATSVLTIKTMPIIWFHSTIAPDGPSSVSGSERLVPFTGKLQKLSPVSENPVNRNITPKINWVKK